MRVIVDTTRCQGHTLCSMTAPQIFVPADDDGHARVVVGELSPQLQALARRAAIACPEQAIRLVEREEAE